MDHRYESKFHWYKSVFLDVSLVTIVFAIIIMSKANIDHTKARITSMAQEQMLTEQRLAYWKEYWKAREESERYVDDKEDSIK